MAAYSWACRVHSASAKPPFFFVATNLPSGLSSRFKIPLFAISPLDTSTHFKIQFVTAYGTVGHVAPCGAIRLRLAILPSSNRREDWSNSLGTPDPSTNRASHPRAPFGGNGQKNSKGPLTIRSAKLLEFRRTLFKVGSHGLQLIGGPDERHLQFGFHQ